MSVKFIEDKGDILAFFPETARFFKVNEDTKLAIKQIEENVPYEELEKQGMDKESYENIKNMVDACNASTPFQPPYGKKHLGKVVLHITNKCNLRCKYCYANGGSYKSEEGIMTQQVAKQALDLFFGEADSIGLVQLFGGEPTLNMPLIKYICEYIKKENAKREQKTQIGIVTNGTNITEEFVQLIKEYSVFVTVSYDGTPEVNDKLRVYQNGKGTSDTILKNIKRLRKETGQPSMLEVTYTQNHVDAGIGIVDMIRDIQKNIGEIPLHIVPAGGALTCDYALSDWEMFGEAVDDIFKEAANMERMQIDAFNLMLRITGNLLTKEYSKYICDAGIRAFSVSHTGDVYPCFIMNGEEKLNMGNVSDKNFFQSSSYKRVIKEFEANNKETKEECKNCFARHSCYECIGLNYLETGDVFKLSKRACDMIRTMTERIIVGLYRMSTKDS